MPKPKYKVNTSTFSHADFIISKHLTNFHKLMFTKKLKLTLVLCVLIVYNIGNAQTNYMPLLGLPLAQAAILSHSFMFVNEGSEIF